MDNFGDWDWWFWILAENADERLAPHNIIVDFFRNGISGFSFFGILGLLFYQAFKKPPF
jgi:hypothetical protein